MLTAGEHDQSWISGQKKLTQLSTNSAQETVNGAKHQALEDDPQYADHISRAVLDVLASARTGQPLTTAP